MGQEGNYQHTVKCPVCGKRKVYIVETEDGFKYVCEVDGKEWDI